MADISTLNGYNLKDAQARSGISTINGKIGSANGIAELDNAGKVPSSQLPSYVDDVVEGYYWDETNRFYEEATHETMITPMGGKSWVDIPSNKSYRWTGSTYVRVDEGVQIGETSDTAYAGNKGKANADAIAAMKDGSSIDSFGDVETALAGKVDKVAGKGLSTNDYDNTAKAVVTTAQDNIKANTKLIKDTIGWSGKNKLPNNAVTVTKTGVTFTVNNDGSVTVNGTATADTFLQIYTASDLTGILTAGKEYIFSGCPVGVTNEIGSMYINGSPNVVSVNGSESKFTYDTSIVRTTISILIKNGKTVSNITFKPMIRDADILDDTYEPYFGSTAFPRNEQAILGARQFIDYDKWKTSEFTRATGVWENNGVTITSTGQDAYVNAGYQIPVKEGVEYKLSWKETEDKYGTIYIFPNGSGTGLVSVDNRNAKELRYTPTSGVTYITFRFGVGNANDTIAYKDVMFTLASDNDTNYSDYSGMTNRELTENVTNKLMPLDAYHNQAGFPFKTYTGSATTFETMENGMWYLSGTQMGNITDKPSTYTSGRCFIMKTKSSDQNIMVLFGAKDNKIWVKFQYTSWSAWLEVGLS